MAFGLDTCSLWCLSKLKEEQDNLMHGFKFQNSTSYIVCVTG